MAANIQPAVVMPAALNQPNVLNPIVPHDASRSAMPKIIKIAWFVASAVCERSQFLNDNFTKVKPALKLWNTLPTDCPKDLPRSSPDQANRDHVAWYVDDVAPGIRSTASPSPSLFDAHFARWRKTAIIATRNATAMVLVKAPLTPRRQSAVGYRDPKQSSASSCDGRL
jgi:hypothetical protein